MKCFDGFLAADGGVRAPVWMAVLCGMMMLVPLMHAQDDPAAHMVIVPYDVEKPVSAQKAERYYLDRATFEKLWSLAKENRKPAADDANEDSPMAVVHSALHRVTVEDERLLMQSRFTVASRGRWARVAMAYTLETVEKNAGPDGGVVMRDWLVDGKPAAFSDGKITLETPGTHEVEVTIELKQQKGWSRARLKTPQAEAGMIMLTLPATDGSPSLGSDVLITEETVGDERVFTAMLGARQTMEIIRSPRRPRTDDKVPATADVEMLVTASDGQADAVTADIRYEFPGTERTRFSLMLDADLRLDGWSLVREGRAVPLKQWTMREADGKRALDFELATPVAESLFLSLQGSRAFASGARKTPLIEPAASRGKRRVGLLHDESVTVVPQPLPTQPRVERAGPKSAVMLGARGRVTELYFQMQAGEPLAYTVGKATSKRECRADYVFQLHTHKQEMMAALTLKNTRESWSQLRIGMPDGFEIQSVSGTALAAWKQEGGDLIVHWQSGVVLPEARLVVYLARSVPEAVQQWTLQPLRLAGFSKHEGTALIVAHAAMETRLEGFTSKPDLREVDPSAQKTVFAVAPPQTVHRALVFERNDWTLNTTLTRQAARFSADTVALAQATEAGLLVSQQVALHVEGGALGRVTLKMPATLPEATVTGEALREVQTRVSGAVREFDCSFQSDVLGRTTLALDVELPPSATLEMPFIEVIGAERLRRFFVLDNASCRESRVLETTGVETCAKSVLPYLPEVMTQPAFYQGKGVAAGRLRIGYEELKNTEGNAAIVTLADITSVWRGDGERWDTVVYSIFNRSLQFLPVILPEKAELIAASVSGAAVRADEEAGADGRRVRLIPLIQTRAGQRSLEVRLVYRLRAATTPAALMRQGRLRMDDPEIPGISAERTTWTAILPKRFAVTDMDGNMEEVVEESRLAEKLQGWLADLGRINRALSSKKDYYDSKSESDYSILEAEKLVKQIEDVAKQADDANSSLQHKQQFKKRSLIEIGEESREKEQALRKQVDGDLAKVREELGKQMIILDENKISQPIFSTRAANVTGNRVTANNWMANGRADAQQAVEFNGFMNYGAPIQTGAASALGNQGFVTLNDNLVVQDEFLKVPVARDSAVTVNGGIAGVGAIAKAGRGTLVLNGANTYTGGGITISSGELQVNLGVPGAETSLVGDVSTMEKTMETRAAITLPQQLPELAQNSASLLNTNARANTFSNGTTVLQQKATSASQTAAITLPPANMDDMLRTTQAEDAAARARLDRIVTDSMLGGAATGSGGFGRGTALPKPATAAPASPAMQAADPFAAAAPPPPAPAPVTAPAAASAKKKAVEGFDAPEMPQSFGLEAQLASQLRVTGRQSLAVEIPADGQAYHFRKLKDHAVLELKIKRAWTPGQRNQAVLLGAGMLIWLGLLAWNKQRK